MSTSGSFVPSQDGSSQGDLTPKPMAHTDGPGGPLKEPGAGWRNDLIELAAVKTDQAPLYSYLEDATEVTREWLKALHAKPEPETCACGTVTTRKVVAAVQGTPIREHALLLTRPQCDACKVKQEIAQLKRSLYTSPYAKDLKPELRAGFEARLKELTKAVA